MDDPTFRVLEHMPIKQQSLRYRVNVAISTKGQKTWDCTVDGEGYEMDEVLAKSDTLVAELEKRYPPQTEGSKT